MANDVVSKTITGSIANFTTNLTRPLQTFKTYFTPNQNGSGDPSPENVRDVISWNSIDVIKCGKNIIGRSGLKASVTTNGITATLRSDGTSYTLSGTATARADLYILSYNTNNYAWQPTSYTISVNAGLALNDSGDYLIISIVDSENTIRYVTTKSSKQFTIASNEKVRGIFIRVAEGEVLDDVVVTPQIEVGSTASFYEPYKSTTYQYSFSPSDPSLVAGTLNITTGELTVTHKKLIIDGTNLDVSDIWKVNTSSTYNSILYALDKDLFGNDTPKYINGKAYPMFNWLAEMTTQTLQAIWHGYLSASNGIVMVIPSGSASTEAHLKSYISAHPLEIGYELAEPQTYQLTPQEITALFGVNNIWTSANGGNEVTYLDKEHADIALSRRRIIMSAPHIESASGSIASFSTDMAANLKECKFAFSPVQEGSGDPSPSNVRPISGWTGMDVGRSQNYHIFEPLSTMPMTESGITLSYLGNGRYRMDGVNNTESKIHFVVPIQPILHDTTFASMLYYNSNKLFADDLQLRLRRSDQTNLYNNYMEYDSSLNNYIISTLRTVSDACPDISEVRFTARPGQGDYEFQPIIVFCGESAPNSYYYDIYFDVKLVSWQSSAGTVYGGYVDLVKGEVVATWAEKTLTQNDTYTIETWPERNRVAWYDYMTLGKLNGTFVCDRLKTISNGQGSTGDDVWEIFGSVVAQRCWITVPTSISSKDDFKAWVAENPVKIIYELATPIHTPITPTILKSLKGVNNIWSNANGDADISYWTH